MVVLIIVRGPKEKKKEKEKRQTKLKKKNFQESIDAV